VTALLIRPPAPRDGGNGTETPAGNATKTPGPTPNPPPDGISAEIRRLVNEERDAAYGSMVPDLRANQRADDMAAYHSRDMAGGAYVGHTSPDGETVIDRYRKFGLIDSLRDGKLRRMIEGGAENIALVKYEPGEPAGDIAERIVGSWTADGEDERWLLDRAWIEHGVGTAHADGFVYATQNFL